MLGCKMLESMRKQANKHTHTPTLCDLNEHYDVGILLSGWRLGLRGSDG